MNSKPLFQKIFAPFMLVSVLAVLSVMLIATQWMRANQLDSTRMDLQVRTQLLIELLGSQEKANPAVLQAAVESRGRAIETRITIIAPDGGVLADSDMNPAEMDNHGERPEVVDSMTQTFGTATRYSRSLNQKMIYVAKRDVDGRVFRCSLPTHEISNFQEMFLGRLLPGILGILLLAMLASLLISRRLARPIQEISSIARAYAQGDLSARIYPSDTRELGELAGNMNAMATQMSSTIGNMEQQQRQQRAMLSGLVESVIALDTEGLVIERNAAADRLLDWGPSVIQRSLRELVRNPSLLDFIERVAQSTEPLEEVIEHIKDDTRTLRAYGSSLKDTENRRIGTLIVLYDVTELLRLENMRRDFVANVSHELKTPTTSIIGFAETLKEGALENPEDAKRFLDIISRQARRLNSIIEDLLSLSRIENEVSHQEVVKSEVNVSVLLLSIMHECQPRADMRQIVLRLNCPKELVMQAKPELLEQALLNLINNAIKYSDEGASVTLTAEAEGEHVILSVKDEGEGIAVKHLDRLFERFYRVDKARTREVGGTGLGLAIVKHVAQAHGGVASVESILGEGSTFRLVLPPI